MDKKMFGMNYNTVAIAIGFTGVLKFCCVWNDRTKHSNIADFVVTDKSASQPSINLYYL